MNRDDRNILFLSILVLILLAVGYYFLLFSPLRHEYLAAYEQRSQKEQQRFQLEQTVAQLENVRRNAPDIERQILEYSKRIPEQDEIAALLVQVEEIAREADVTQFQMAPGSPEGPPGGGDFLRIPITMTFQGTYEEMQDFLLRLRNLSRLVTVNELTYCRSPDLITDANCPIEGERGRGETTGPSSVEDQLAVAVVAEVYVQPTAQGAEAPPSPEGGEAKGGEPQGGSKAKGAEAKGGGSPK